MQPAGVGRNSPGPPAIPGFEVLEEISRGGMGIIYKARQLGLNRLVALKMILSGPYSTADEEARFRGEAEAAARLKHANIVQIFQIGEHAGYPYFALEFVDGGNLAKRLAGAPLPALQAAAICTTLARAVSYAHEQGVLHRDLKPANVLLEPANGVHGSAVDATVADRELSAAGPGPARRGPLSWRKPRASVPRRMANQVPSSSCQRSPTGGWRNCSTSSRAGLSRARSWARRATWRRSRRPAWSTLSARRPTFIRSGRFFTRCSRGARRFGPRPCGKRCSSCKPRNRSRPASCNRDCREISRRFASNASRRSRRGATRRRRTWPRICGGFAPASRSRPAPSMRPNEAGVGWAATAWRRLCSPPSRSFSWGASSSRRSLPSRRRRRRRRPRSRRTKRTKTPGRLRQAVQETYRAVDRYFTLVSENRLLDVPDATPLRRELLSAALEYYQKLPKSESEDAEIQAELAAAYLRMSQIEHITGSGEIARLAKGMDIIERLLDAKTPIATFKSLDNGIVDVVGGRGMGMFDQELPESIKVFQRGVDVWERLLSMNPLLEGFSQRPGWVLPGTDVAEGPGALIREASACRGCKTGGASLPAGARALEELGVRLSRQPAVLRRDDDDREKPGGSLLLRERRSSGNRAPQGRRGDRPEDDKGLSP